MHVTELSVKDDEVIGMSQSLPTLLLRTQKYVLSSQKENILLGRRISRGYLNRAVVAYTVKCTLVYGRPKGPKTCEF